MLGQPRISFFLMQNETLHQSMQLQTSRNALLQTAETQSGNSRNKLLLVFKRRLNLLSIWIIPDCTGINVFYLQRHFLFLYEAVCERNIARYPQKAQKEDMNLNKELTDLTYILIQKRQYDLGKAEDIFLALILQSIKILRLVLILNLYLVQLRNILKFYKTDRTLIYSDE